MVLISLMFNTACIPRLAGPGSLCLKRDDMPSSVGGGRRVLSATMFWRLYRESPTLPEFEENHLQRLKRALDPGEIIGVGYKACKAFEKKYEVVVSSQADGSGYQIVPQEAYAQKVESIRDPGFDVIMDEPTITEVFYGKQGGWPVRESWLVVADMESPGFSTKYLYRPPALTPDKRLILYICDAIQYRNMSAINDIRKSIPPAFKRQYRQPERKAGEKDDFGSSFKLAIRDRKYFMLYHGGRRLTIMPGGAAEKNIEKLRLKAKKYEEFRRSIAMEKKRKEEEDMRAMLIQAIINILNDFKDPLTSGQIKAELKLCKINYASEMVDRVLREYFSGGLINKKTKEWRVRKK